MCESVVRRFHKMRFERVRFQIMGFCKVRFPKIGFENVKLTKKIKRGGGGGVRFEKLRFYKMKEGGEKVK